MAFYRHLFPPLKAACPFLLPTQAANLALLVGAIVQQRTLNLTRLAQSFPIPAERRVTCPKHELLHRLKRLSRFLSNRQGDPVAVQVACIPTLLAHLGHPRWLGLLLDWTSFDVALPGLVGGGIRKYQVLTIAVPRCGRAVPLLSVTYERGKLPATGSQNRWEEAALAQVLDALPLGVRPVVIGDRGFGRAGLLEWLQARGIDYVLRLRRGALITAADGSRWKLGAEGLRPGQIRWAPTVRYGTYHDRPRDLWIHLACSWRLPKRRRSKQGKEYQEPWYLATSLGNLGTAVAWYRQRRWLEETLRDFHTGFRLDAVQVASVRRLGRLVAALSLALAWLQLLAEPKTRLLPAAGPPRSSPTAALPASRSPSPSSTISWSALPTGFLGQLPDLTLSLNQPDTGYGSAGVKRLSRTFWD